MCGDTKMYIYDIYVVAQRCIFMSMSGETKMFIYVIYVWWNKDVY